MNRVNLAAGMLVLTLCQTVYAADYVIDTDKAHAFIQFRIQHLGFSWLYGRFNSFSGDFSYDEREPQKARVAVQIDANSIDTNHAERDKHLRSADFFDVEMYPDAEFVSTNYKALGNGKGVLSGKLTLRGVTRPIELNVAEVGAGKDPWGGYRMGFLGTTTLSMDDYGFPPKLGAAAKAVELTLSIEGIRK